MYSIGKRFGRRVIKQVVNATHVFCTCDCGTEQKVRKDSLKYNKSCGCARSEVTAARNRTHGLSKTIEYSSWCHMIERCLNANCKEFKHYGARGIEVCKRWLKFKNFLADMGVRPSLNHSLERKDNGGSYCKKNCKWATQQEQCNNQRRNIRVEIDGKVKTLKQWAVEFGIPYQTVYYRIRRGWSPSQACSMASLAPGAWSTIKGLRAGTGP